MSWGGKRPRAGRPRKRPKHGGTRPGAGRPRVPDDVKQRRGTLKASRQRKPDAPDTPTPSVDVILALVGLVPRRVCMAVAAVWTPELERVWAAEAETLNREAGLTGKRAWTARTLAESAIRYGFDGWRALHGPEYAARELRRQGVEPEKIEETIRRAFGRPADPEYEPVPPPTLDELVGWLLDGSLLEWLGVSAETAAEAAERPRSGWVAS